MSNSLISARQLLKDAFAYVSPVYLPMLVFFVPNLIISLLVPTISSPSASSFLLLINAICIFPFVTGASIFYVHQNLTNRGATIPDSLQAAGEKFFQLVLLTILLLILLIPALILLVIPGIYLIFRWSFVFYAVMIENCSASDALGRSWKLTEGHWWLIFRAALLFFLVFFIPALIIIFIVISIDSALSEPAGGVIGLLLGPVSSTYYVFLFMSLVNLGRLHDEV